MNKTYRLVWNELAQTWIAVAETAGTRGKRASRAVLLGATLAVSSAPTLGQSPAPPAPTALPTGGNVVAGSATISQAVAVMTITQTTQRAAIDWQTFDVGSQARVNFVQPSSSAVILNRVLSGNPSQIFGQITANGHVYLTNASGAYFAPGARVHVGSLLATTHSIGNDDFMKGNDVFSRNGATGRIVNEGELRAELGGYVALLAPEVRNKGVILAQKGTVALAAGEAFELQFAGGSLANVRVEPATVAALVENGHAIEAPGGLIILSARAADQLQGSVVRNSGTLEAGSLVERGGKIMLTGDHISLDDGSRTIATGATGGGEVLVGGGWQGSGGHYQATTVTMARDALIDVSTKKAGAGGTAVLWSDITKANSETRAHGTIWAKGGTEGGDGGRIETSGHWLSITGSRGGASATNGTAGLWLLDPYNVTITGANANGGFGSSGGTDTWTPNANNSTILNTDINSKLEGGTNVTITTTGAGSQIGDITVSSAITKGSGNTDVTLTLQAANSIVVDQAISNSGGAGKLHVVLDADNNNGTRDGGGVIILNNDITTGGGNLSFGTGATMSINGVTTKVGGDVYVAGSGARSLNTDGGNVTVNGEMLIANTSGLTVTTNGGNVSFGGVLNSGNSYTFVDKTGSAGTGTWDDARTEAKGATGGGSAVNDTYLVTITSRLENALATRSTNYVGAWIGAYRPDQTTGAWKWADGPESGQTFFNQNSTGGSGTTVSGYYANFDTGEPNGNITAVGTPETRGQIFGEQAKWNDLVNTRTYSNDSSNQYNVLGFIRETNLAASPLTISAGSGNVTFSGAVGGSKALASLSVTSTGTIAINGGAVTTTGAQTYNGNVTLGSSSTTLTQTTADTDFTLQAGKSITNATGANASLLIKTTRDINLASASAISSSTGALSVTLNSDSDATNGGAIWLQTAGGTAAGATISSNGGDITLSGGTDVTTGYAQGRTATIGNGITLDAATLNSAGGNILLRGKGTTGGPTSIASKDSGTSTNSDGIRLHGSNSINAGAGTFSAYGVAQGTGASNGIELSQSGTTTIQSSNTTANAILLDGSSSNAGASNGYGVYTHGYSSILATNGGGITLNGTGAKNAGVVVASGGSVLANSGKITLNGSGVGTSGNEGVIVAGIVGQKAATAITSSSSAIDVIANTISVSGTLQTSGALTVRPRTAGTTIGIAGGTGTLQLPASYFSSPFANGFSSITIGSADAGLISVGGSALSYNDPLTLKTGNSIFFGATSSVTGNGNALTLWTRAGGTDAGADGIDGSVWLPAGASINTGGGNITIGGGTDPTTGYALGDNNAVSGENNARVRGVSINGTLNAAGGNISIRGRGNSSPARGVSIGGAISTTGSGNITIVGLAQGTSDGVALGDGAVGGATGTLSAVNGTISITGTKGSGGTNGVSLATAASGISITGTGALVIDSSGNINGVNGSVSVGGTTSLTAGTGSITLTNTANNFGGAVTVVSAGDFSLIDSNALTLAAVTSSGLINVATLAGDITLTGALSTTNATSTAMVLNAGKNSAAGTATGGNILVSGSPTISVGTGGRATLYTGSVAGSTGLTALVGSGSGRFRYNSDETATNYTEALGAGSYAIYREQPTVTITANSYEKMFDGEPYSGGNGVTYALANGDSSAMLSGTVTYGGSSQGAKAVGTYAITPGGTITNTLGYAAPTFVGGTLTVKASPTPPPPATAPVPLPSPTSNPPPMTTSATGDTVAQGPATGGVSVSLVREPSVQQAGVIAVSVPKEMATAGSGFSFPLPATVAEAAGSAPVRVNLPNGDPLPAWLQFEPKTKAFVATAVPDGAFPIQVVVTIGGNSVTIVISERKE